MKVTSNCKTISALVGDYGPTLGIRLDVDSSCIVATHGRAFVKVPVELDEGDETTTISVACWKQAVALAKASKLKQIQIKTTATNCTLTDGSQFPSITNRFVDWNSIYKTEKEKELPYSLSINPLYLKQIQEATGADAVTLKFKVDSNGVVSGALVVVPYYFKGSTAIENADGLVMPLA